MTVTPEQIEAYYASIDRDIAAKRGTTVPPLEDVDDTANAGAWDKPTPLPNALPAVERFAPELLPEVLRPWVLDIAHRMQCPPDFPAVGVLVALSGLIGARAVIAPKQRDDWRVVPNLWGLIVGRPSVMKSPALTQCMAPLKRLEATENERHSQALKEWKLDKKLAEMAEESNAKKAKELAKKDPAAARALLSQEQDIEPEPAARRYVVNDSTVEALGEILEVNPWGVLAYRDELHGLLKSLDRDGQEGSRSFYLQGYDGNQSYTFDRIMRGRTHLERVCIALLGGIQPAKLQSYVRDAVTGGNGDDGLLQRFGLAVWPDAKSEFRYVDQWPDTPAKKTAWTVFERLNALQPATPDEAQEWRFSPDAQAMFKEWMTAFETRIRGDGLHDAMVSHLAKYRKLVPALALLFALIDTPDAGGVVHETELARALAWSEYLESHANRIYAAAMMPETAGAESLLAKIKSGKLMDSDGVLMQTFAARDVAQKHWAGLGTPDEVNKAAALLADYGWLRKEVIHSTAKGGRPSARYEIHPALIGG